MRIPTYSVLGVVVAAAVAASPAFAAWHDFAKNESAPEIAQLDIAGRQMEDLVEVLELYPEELKAGQLLIRGKAETTRGLIGAVLISVDGGKNFFKAKVEQSGMFLYSFSPVLSREYEFQIKVLDTTGRASDSNSGAFRMVVRPDVAKQQAVELFTRLLELYKGKDRGGFMALVAEEFEGNRAILEEGLEKDFNNLDSIRIFPAISRIARVGKVVEIYFNFTRSVKPRTSNKTLTDKSNSNMSFIRQGDQMVLYSMAAPLIFGVAATEDVATGVEFSSQGDKILAVTDDGDVVKVEQQQSVSGTSDQVVSNIVSGTLNVNCTINVNTIDDYNEPRCPAIKLDRQASSGLLSSHNLRHSDMAGTGADVSININNNTPNPGPGCLWALESDSGMMNTGKNNFSQIETVSSDPADYVPAIPNTDEFPVALNQVVAVRTPVLYSLLRATKANCTFAPGVFPAPSVITIDAAFEYRIQLSQNPTFR